MRTGVIVICGLLTLAEVVLAEPRTQDKSAKQTPGGQTAEDMNIRAYIELLRSDVRKEKSGIVAEVMQLSADEAAKFWPVYKDYEAEMTRTGDEKLAGIKKYAENYENMTEAVADQLAQAALNLEEKRHQIKRKYYQRVKQELGAITAARFLQVENQLLMVVDLQLAASLPVIGSNE